MKKGEIDLKNDKRFNQLLDTFDLLRSYNINGKAPLDAKYEVDPVSYTHLDVYKRQR